MTVQVKIKPGYGSHTTWEDGVARRYQAGDSFSVTDQEFRDFRYKFEKVREDVNGAELTQEPEVTAQPTETPSLSEEDEEPFDLDVANANVSDILAAVRAEKLSASEALEAEQSRDKPRESLVRALTARIEGETNDD